MSIINTIISKMDSYNKSESGNEKIKAVFNDKKNYYGGDLISSVVKAQKMKLTDVAAACNIDLRSFQNARSKKSKYRREITKFEILRVAVVLNLEPSYTEQLLARCHVVIPKLMKCDIAIAAVVFTNHNTPDEMYERLSCLGIIENHYLDFDFDFKKAFRNLNKQMVQ